MPKLSVKITRKAVESTWRGRFQQWWKCRVKGDHEWVEVKSPRGNDIGLYEDRCKHCPVHRSYVA